MTQILNLLLRLYGRLFCIKLKLWSFAFIYRNCKYLKKATRQNEYMLISRCYPIYSRCFQQISILTAGGESRTGLQTVMKIEDWLVVHCCVQSCTRPAKPTPKCTIRFHIHSGSPIVLCLPYYAYIQIRV